MAVLPKRFEKYGLILHPQKTRTVEFVRPDLRSRRAGPGAEKRPGTFDFLGFTHYWGCSRSGKLLVRRKVSPLRTAWVASEARRENVARSIQLGRRSAQRWGRSSVKRRAGQPFSSLVSTSMRYSVSGH